MYVNCRASDWTGSLCHQLIPVVKLLNRFQISKGPDFSSKEVVSTVLESPHPYRPAMRKKYALSFPKNVGYMVLVCIICF